MPLPSLSDGKDMKGIQWHRMWNKGWSDWRDGELPKPKVERKIIESKKKKITPQSWEHSMTPWNRSSLLHTYWILWHFMNMMTYYFWIFSGKLQREIYPYNSRQENWDSFYIFVPYFYQSFKLFFIRQINLVIQYS